ncbi:MAG: ankyrin repeat domain-containing protein [Eggerthellaceae bacterium]|nr:ankyrin repeat domain-containing protein [Eggerthellaceae bacterium]
MALRMNRESGRELFELCRFAVIWDIGDFVEDVGIMPEQLQRYFNGECDLSEQDLCSLAGNCGKSADDLREILVAAYERGVKREQQDREEEALRAERLEALIKARRKREELEACEQRILEELGAFGITRVQADNPEYPLEGYYAPKFLLYYLDKEEALPLLQAKLAALSDEDLLFQGGNALFWAAGSDLAYEKLLILADRKDFIAAHIHDRGKEGQTVLHYYAHRYSARPEGVALLAGWGADIDATDDDLWTPLHNAAASQNDAVFAALIALGAKSTKNAAGDYPRTIADWLDALDAW